MTGGTQSGVSRSRGVGSKRSRRRAEKEAEVTEEVGEKKERKKRGPRGPRLEMGDPELWRRLGKAEESSLVNRFIVYEDAEGRKVRRRVKTEEDEERVREEIDQEIRKREKK